VEEFADRYGPWAVVAGASTGLGAAFADECASRGLNVVVLARRRELLEQTAAGIRDRHGVEVRPVTLDMADPEVGTKLAGATDDIDVGLAIYNAAAEPQGPFIETPLEDLLSNITVNCATPTIFCYHFAPKMAARGKGGIVLVSSMAALQGIKIFTHYGAGKAYELILGEGLWDELRDLGVDALTYVVGSTATPNFLENARQMAAPDPAELEKLVGAGALENAAPRSPESVAAALFDQIGAGPRAYSHPDDKASAEADATKTREEVVSAIGKMTSLFWR
jgi:short-subunit dehydrogenase